MVQILNDSYSGNVFGRIGKGLGQGLSEQIPKEVNRYRLSEGLKNLEKESGNLTPMQYFTRAISVPGAIEHPQVVQSLGELARQQNIRNAYANQANVRQEQRLSPDEIKQNLQQANQGNIRNQQFANITPETRRDYVRPSEVGQPQAVETNPLREAAVPKKEWTPQRRDQDRAEVGKKFPWMSDTQVNEMSADNERRELAQPLGEQAIDTYNQEQAEKIENALTKKMELLTHKKGPDLFKDITGEMQNNFQRTVARDIRENPSLTVEDAVNKRAQQLVQIPKAKQNVNQIASRPLGEKLNPLKKKENLSALYAAAKIFDDVGDNKELYNMLKTKTSTDENGNKIYGTGLSPVRAAEISYPIKNNNIKGFLKSIKPKRLEDPTRNGIYYASQVAKLKQPEDSILAIGQAISDIDPYFSWSTYLSEFRNNNEYTLSPDQQLEVIEVKDYFPNWGDIALFPFGGTGKRYKGDVGI